MYSEKIIEGRNLPAEQCVGKLSWHLEETIPLSKKIANIEKTFGMVKSKITSSKLKGLGGSNKAGGNIYSIRIVLMPLLNSSYNQLECC